MRVRPGVAVPGMALLALVAGAPEPAAPSPGAAAAGAPAVQVIGPPGADTLRDLTPTFRIVVTGTAATTRPASVTLQIARTADMAAPLVLDTTVSLAGLDTIADVALQRPLPELSTLYWRGLARLTDGTLLGSAIAGPRPTPRWLELRFPNDPAGTTVDTTRPQFVWASARLSHPTLRWRYALTIRNASTRHEVTAGDLFDTTYTPAVDLEAHTPYRWEVVASLASGDTARAASAATFVVVRSDLPRLTLLYQNFPNPFPSGTSLVTCVWFDLRVAGRVFLDVLDLRGHRVRRLVPATGSEERFAAGRYGREPGTPSSGCDPRFAWDGTTDDGTIAPAGVYLLRLRTEDGSATRKILFRGR